MTRTSNEQTRQTSLGIKALIPLVMIAGLSMGNEGCEEKPESARVLKMDIEIGALKGRMVRLPNGESVDFPYVANSLFYRQVINHDHFVIGNPVPSSLGLLSSGGSFKTMKADDASSGEAAPSGLVSGKDVSVLDQYGLLKSTRIEGASLLSGEMKEREVVEGKATASAVTKLPACLYDLPQALLGGEVISFEATGGGGIGIGYNSGGDVAGGVGGRINFEQSRLEIGLRTDDPLSQQAITIGDGVAHQSRVAFGIDFVPGVPVGLNFFFNTPITDVIRNAMDVGLDAIVDRYKVLLSVNRDWNEVWESRVIYDPEIVNNDTHIAFRGGYRAGVQVGDTFNVTNLHYAWEGAACYTRLKYKIPLTTTPVAEATVVSVGDNVSVAVVKYLMDQKIQPGAQIKVLALKQPTPARASASNSKK
jgi:hypothetical protein